MSKKVQYLFALLLFLSLFCGCAEKKSKEDVSSGRKIIAVTIAPQGWFIRELLGDAMADSISIQVMVPKGMNPEEYDPTPKTIISLESASLFFSLGIFPYEKRWIDALDTLKTRVVDISVALPAGMLHLKDEKHTCGRGVHQHGDPHYWSSFVGGRLIAQKTYEVLQSLFPEQQEILQGNYLQLCEKIDEEEAKSKTQHANNTSRCFLIYHPSLTQYSLEMNLIQMTIEQEGKAPTPAQLAHLIKNAQEKRPQVLLIQEEFPPESAHVLADQLGLPVVLINPFDEDWLGQMKLIRNAISPL